MIESWDGREPRVDPLAWVHGSAVLIGDVEVGPHASVWPGSVLRGDMGLIRVGAWSNLQDGVICHDTADLSRTLVGERCTVGHRAILHGCIIEDECLIGMGSIIMDNAVIGRGSLIGAGALISPGKVIPPRSLVMGMPGRVVRGLTDAEVEGMQGAWKTYADKAARWRDR